MAGAILAELLNVNLINSTFCSKTATEMEIAVIRWLRTMVGFPVSVTAPASSSEVGGMALTGGTLANFTAILLARGRFAPDSAQRGITGDGEVFVAAPQGIVHYTMRAGLSWSGLGSASLLEFPIRDYRYDLSALDSKLRDLAIGGRKLMMAVVYAGDSRTMTIDNLTGVQETFRSYYPDIWMHCDGCHGTSLLFSEKKRIALAGISDYDSVTLDPHKVLNVPYNNSFLLLRNPPDAELVQTDSDLIMRQARSLGQTTPAVGSKQFSSLRTWMLMKALGARGIGKMIDDRVELATRFMEQVDMRPIFIRLNEVNINSVVFMANPYGKQDLTEADVDFASEITLRVYNRMLTDGRAYIHSFEVFDSGGVLTRDIHKKVNVFRYMGGNPSHTSANLIELLDILEDYIKLEIAESEQHC